MESLANRSSRLVVTSSGWLRLGRGSPMAASSAGINSICLKGSKKVLEG